MARREQTASYLRTFVFGVEDSLVSTVGLLAGVATAGVPRETILLTGVVLIFVEAFSMAIGSFLSEYSAEEYLRKPRPALPTSLTDSLIMFFSYLLAGLIPLFPYAVFEGSVALTLSIVFSLVALFFLGIGSGEWTGTRLMKSGLRMLVIGGLAIAVGVIVSRLVTAP